MAVNQSESLQQTPLYDLHLELNARMVPFAGYQMPVQFEGVKAEHLHTRMAAGLFDVSHMGQLIVQGNNADEMLESLVPADLKDLPVNKQLYTQLLNADGGIIDDLMIARLDNDCFSLVINAACKEKDLHWLRANLQSLTIDEQNDKALLALQGPAAADVLADLFPESHPLKFMHACESRYDHAPVYITRAGYTGEDGFEISLPADKADSLARQLLAFHDVKAIGLGARDTLRLEAGLCLYGHDLDESTTPVSAALAWSISKARRKDGARAGGFPGDKLILDEMNKGSATKRVGLHIEGRAPVREGAELVDENHQCVGKVTSGGYGPSVEAPIAIGYIDSSLAKQGLSLFAMVRGKALPVSVTTLPFVLHRYVK